MNMHSADATTVEEALAVQAQMDSDTATAMAMEETLLSPRFYTTDFDEMDAIDVEPVRQDWDRLIAQMVSDPNRGHFKKNEDQDHIDWRNGTRSAQGVYRFSGQLLYLGIFRLCPL